LKTRMYEHGDPVRMGADWHSRHLQCLARILLLNLRMSTARRFLSIRKCAGIWRREQSRAAQEGDHARAALARTCAERWEAYLRTRTQVRRSRPMKTIAGKSARSA
jgi:hypothetical protein